MTEDERAEIIAWCDAIIREPDAPGGYVGDVWFGHPEDRTLATHRWSGTEWVVFERPSHDHR
jgi:hypothetical protein